MAKIKTIKKDLPFDLERHPYFKKWIDPLSGIESFILQKRVAPIQQSFYFTNPSVSSDGKWLWFYTAYPPNRQRTLAAVSLDPDNPYIKHYPQAGFSSVSPLVAPEGDSVYFCAENNVYKMNISGEVETVCVVPESYIGNRQYNRIATHLSISADKKYLLLDGDLGNFWWVGTGDLETGEVTILKEFGEHHDHALFSPTDPELFLIPQDWWRDKISGHYFPYNHRLWLMNIGQTRFEPVCPHGWYPHSSRAAHEWWSKDGLICWNEYDKGTYECDPYSLEKTHVWKRPLCHAHCNSSRQYWCADESPYKWETKAVEILFYDRINNSEKHIVSAMPPPPVARSMYHLDPHPQFSPCDNWIVYTTTVKDKVDIALCPVKNIL
jgi:hypothetical protein